MGKLITILPKVPKKPNAHSVRGGYFPLPLQIVGPDIWHTIMSADYGINPIDGTHLGRPTFDQVAELVGDALTDRYKHRKDGKFNPAFNPVICSINDSGKVLTGNSLMVVVPGKKAYFVNNPSPELRAQSGVDKQEVLEEIVDGFEKQLKGIKEREGIAYARDIVAVSVANVFQGEQSRDSKDETYLGKNLGLIALTRGKKVARSLAVGSKAYKCEPYFSLNGVNNEIVTRVPVLDAVDFGYWLNVDGDWYAGAGGWCSFGYFESGEATAPKIR